MKCYFEDGVWFVWFVEDNVFVGNVEFFCFFVFEVGNYFGNLVFLVKNLVDG